MTTSSATKRDRKLMRAAREATDHGKLAEEIRALRKIQAIQADPKTEAFNARINDRLDIVRSGKTVIVTKDTTGPSSAPLRRTIADKYEALRERDKFEQQTLTDGLTGLWNRRGAVTQINHMVAELNRQNEEQPTKAQSCISVLFCDLDDFGKINKKFGNAIGDQALKALGETLKHGRGTDIFVRAGGEEILGFAHHESKVAEGIFARNIVRKVRDIQIELPKDVIAGLAPQDKAAIFTGDAPKTPPYYDKAKDAYAIRHDKQTDTYWLGLSVSVGAARIHPTRLGTLQTFSIEDTESPIGKVVAVADEGMRRAKANGKNGFNFVPNDQLASPARTWTYRPVTTPRPQHSLYMPRK